MASSSHNLLAPGTPGRTCGTTGLGVCLDAQRFIKLNAVSGIVFLLLGGIAALLLALTRWQTVHLLPVDWFYRILTFHGINMLILWILFFEVAILYFACTTPLNARLFSRKVAWVSFGLMLVGGIMVDYIILAGQADVMMTSYLPLLAHPLFYLGIILVAVGTLVGVFNFFATLYVAKRDGAYEGSMPIVTFGALAAAIIAVVTLLHGAVVMIPTFTYAMGWTAQPDPAWYRLIWWGLGHQSQQVNVCAMVAVWYLLSHIVVGARPINEAVCRSAFVLYILFINLASAHHLLVDPGVGATWKIWNTSYAMYLAVLASMVHGFTVPAGVEIAMREKGYTSGIFGWVTALPWRNPAFSATALSVVIFGFLGGITGVTLGTQQINIIAHNTLRIPGHFHVTVVGGTSLAFMGLAYYVVPLIFQRDFIFRGVARVQPWLFGIGGILAFLGLLTFVLLCVGTLLFGAKIENRPMADWGTPPALAGSQPGSLAHAHYATKGTIVLTLVFLACFAVYYFANWKALADVWPVR